MSSSSRESANIARVLLHRETGSLRGRNPSKCQTSNEASRVIGSWTERDFMQHCSGQYVEFKPIPRSTIAASFSPNGCFLASTHGDHTVKIVDCFHGTCHKVLEGHTRTPWVVRFHPLDSDILASGSLDHRVVIWRVSTAEKLYTHDFGKPIASIAFHPSGKALVVASGHKVYFWDYMKSLSSSRPNPNPLYILRTKRSLRALHFHPLGLPLILTGEVVESKKPAATEDTAAPSAARADHARGATPPAPPIAPHQRPQPPQEQQLQRQQRQHAAAAGASAGAGASAASASLPPAPLSAEVSNLTSGVGHLSLLGTALSDVAMRVLDLAGMRLPGTLQAVARVLLHHTRTAGAATAAAAAADPDRTRLSDPPAQSSGAPAASGLLNSLSFHRRQQARPTERGDGADVQSSSAPVPSLPPAAAQHSWSQPRVQQQGSILQQPESDGLRVDESEESINNNLAGSGRTAPPALQAQPAPSPRVDAGGEAAAPTAAADAMAPLVPTQIAAISAAAAAAMSAMAHLRLGLPPAGSAPAGSAPAEAGGTADSGGRTLPEAGGARSSERGPTVDLAMCDPWGMQRIRSVGGMETLAFPLEPQPLGPMYDLSWGWHASGPTAAAAAEPPQRHNALPLLESQLVPLAMTSEQPCVVNLNIWSFNHRRPSSTLDKPRLSVPRAVLCSEMGAQFSPCGRFLAMCVAVDEPSEACRVWLQGLVRQSKERMAVAEALRNSTLAGYGGSGSRAGSNPESRAGPGPGLEPHSTGHWWNSFLKGGSADCPASSSSTASSSAAAAANTSTYPNYMPSELRATETGFKVPIAEAWELFPNSVPWMEFPAATSEAAVREAVRKAREMARLSKPLYELRTYSLDGSSFGQVLQARLIRAAHCLTSVQFSPTSEHLLVAYGRRYISLCHLIAEGTSLVPAHTVVEVYSTKDLQLVRVLPSLEDEVNVATFHPVPGAGLVYGTKEGRLRMLRYDRRTPRRPSIPLSTNGGRMDAELAAAERDDSNSEEEELGAVGPESNR